MWMPSMSTFLHSMVRMKEGRSAGAAFWYSSGATGFFRSSVWMMPVHTPRAWTPSGWRISFSHSALSVVMVPRPRIVMFSRSWPPISGIGVMPSVPSRRPFVYVRPSRVAGNLRTAPASISSTRLLTISIGPVMYLPAGM